MAYEPKPGSFSLFKNDRKEKDSHPDYKGDGIDLDGKPVWVSAWLKHGAKGTFMSCSMNFKEAKKETPSKHSSNASGGFQDFADDIPFSSIGRGVKIHCL